MFDCSGNEQERNEVLNLLEIQSPENINTKENITIFQDILENNNHENSLKQFAKFILPIRTKKMQEINMILYNCYLDLLGYCP